MTRFANTPRRTFHRRTASRVLPRLVAALALLACLPSAPAAASARAPGDWAVVGADGALARGVGVLASAPLAPGLVEVAFNRDVSACAFVATPGTTGPGTLGVAAVATVASGATSQSVLVATYDRSGVASPLPFHLQVDCNPNHRWAVVDASGTLVRGSQVLSASRTATGVYTVENQPPSRANKCSITATIGSSAGGMVTPGIATVGGAGFHVDVHTWTLAGVPTDLPFQLHENCWPYAPFFVTGYRSYQMLGYQQLAPGEFALSFAPDARGCSETASIGGNRREVVPPASSASAARRWMTPRGWSSSSAGWTAWQSTPPST